MSSPPAIRDPEHWLSRAKEARALARQLADPSGRGLMQEIAEGYERLAAEAAARQRASND